MPKDSFKLLRYHHKYKIRRYCAWLYSNIPFKNNNKSLEFILLSYPSFSEGEYQLVITPTRYIFIVIIIESRRETYLFLSIQINAITKKGQEVLLCKKKTQS